jgi:hypothetical protein
MARRTNSRLLVPKSLLLILVLVLVICPIGYGLAVGSARQAVLELLVGAAAAMIGALIGFLFGIPRYLQPQRPRNARSSGTGESSEASSRDEAPPQVRSYGANTNLEDVSDWLTKLLIGLGLVEFDRLRDGLRALGEWVGREGPAGASSPIVVTGALVVVCGGAALGAGYLWTQLHYYELVSMNEAEITRKLKELEAKANAATLGIGGKLATASGRLLPIVEPTAEGSPETLVGRTEAESWQARLLERERREAKSEWLRAAIDALRMPSVEDDPNAGRFGGEPSANGRILRGTVKASAETIGQFDVDLAVEAVVSDRPLRGTVAFFLHPTFNRHVVEVPVKDGVASIMVTAYGAFTVGALADTGQTCLELNLATLRSAPREFTNA